MWRGVGQLTDSGALSFTDADDTDGHTVTAATTAMPSGRAARLSPAQIDAISGGFAADTNSWDYSVANAALQFLGAGETDHPVLQRHGHRQFGRRQRLRLPRSVTVTITGSQRRAGADGRYERRRSPRTGVVSGQLSDSGTLSFTDADDTTATRERRLQRRCDLDGGAPDGGPGGGDHQRGSRPTPTAGTTASRTPPLQFLGNGESITLCVHVTVTDDSGAANNSDTEMVTLTITGTNDAPVLTVDTSGGGHRGRGGGAGQLTDSGTLSFTDADDQRRPHGERRLQSAMRAGTWRWPDRGPGHGDQQRASRPTQQLGLQRARTPRCSSSARARRSPLSFNVTVDRRSAAPPTTATPRR